MRNSSRRVRVFGFVATEADVCVLLRQDLSRRTLMIRWNLATDEFEVGQWLKAWIVDGDLSPDGRLFSYEAYKRLSSLERSPDSPSGLSYESYNAVSRPPYFTALAYWQETGENFRLRWGADPDSESAPPPQAGGLPSEYANRLSLTRSQEPTWRLKDLMFGPLRRIAGVSNLYGLGEKGIEVDWADADHQGRLLTSHHGRIFVRDENGERELIDLGQSKFLLVNAPDGARTWPEPTP